MRIVFMGTPRFAAVSLEHLLRAKKEVSLVVSQPDRERGRGRRIEQTATKKVALEQGVDVAQPHSPNSSEFLESLRQIAPDLLVVVSYGHILKPALLDLPSAGCVNLHPSLLPKYRGAAPIEWAVIEGEKRTGITTIFMNEKMDAGEMIEQVTVDIGEEETAGELRERLAVKGAELLLSTVGLIERGEAKNIPQDDTQATYAPKIQPEVCRIDWSENHQRIARLIRGLSPSPGAYSFFRGKRMRLLRAVPSLETSTATEGELLTTERLLVRAEGGWVWLKELQPEGKKPISDIDFINGYHPVAHEKME